MTISRTLLASCLSCLGCASHPPPTPITVSVVEATMDQDPTALRARISELEQRLATERAAKTAAETRERALLQRVHELEGQALNLTLGRIRMEQELLRTKVAILRDELGDQPGDGREPRPVPIENPTPADAHSSRSERVLEGVRIPGTDRR